MEKKKQDLLVIGVLVVVTVIVVAIFVAILNKDGKGNEENNVGQVSDPNLDENQVEEEFVTVLDDNTKVNISDKLKEPKTVNGIEITDIQLTNQDGQTVLLANATNKSGKDIDDETYVSVTLLDKNEEEIITVNGLLSPLKAGQSTQFNTSMTLDYANAYDFKVVVK